MKLKKIQITNFKSIGDLSFDFEKNYHVLAGKNESGKTNILDAISYLNQNKQIDKACIREPLPDEDPISESEIRFVFTPDTNSQDVIYDFYKSLFLNYNDWKNNQLADLHKTKISVDQFFYRRLECLTTVDFLESTRRHQYWSINKNYKICKNWKKIVDSVPQDTTLVLKKNKKTISIGSAKIIDTSYFEEVPDDLIEELTADFLNTQIGTKLTKLLETNNVNCIHWFYDSTNLLPSKVVLNDFKETPNICLPLKYLFNLAKIYDIKADIDQAIQRGSKTLKNLLTRVSRRATDFFNAKWQEYDNVEFDLTLNGTHIDIGIKEENCFDLSQRSDGFKRFITFLIMISAQVETNQLEKSVLLIDEPEISLHPSGQRFLKAELRKISLSNIVVFSTHSIFLIDADNLENHYIVEKKNEETQITTLGVSNIVDEEVVYNALGYSVFEILSAKNILFEGWRDKQLFKIAISRIPSQYKELKLLKNYGVTHAQGVKTIKYITPILELANRNCLITSDSDKPAKEKQKNYQSEPQPYKWYCYDELLNDEIAVTAEDFVKSDFIIKTLKAQKEKYNLAAITTENLKDSKGKMHAITNWLKPSSKDNIKSDLNDFKENLFEKLKVSHIEPKYYKLLKNIYQLENENRQI